MTEHRDGIHASKGAVAGGLIMHSVIQIINAQGGNLTEEEARQRERLYLQRVMQDCAGLEWLRMVGKQDESAPRLGLDSVYTALLTEALVTEPNAMEQDRKRQISAVELLNENRKVVLTGDPGSGKSAFVSYLALCMAGESLGDERANLHLLTEPLPDKQGKPETEEIKVDGKKEKERREVRQPWEHGVLVPVRIILRDFSASSHFPAEKDTPDVCQVMAFLQSELESWACGDYYEVLKARLRTGEALVMFDGLDEVPQAGDRRKRLRGCIEGFVKTYSGCRVLVTCRPYAYRDKQWQLDGFAATQLAEFGRGQMIRFIQRWYGNSPEFDADAAEVRANKLQQAILGRATLFELAKRPLLLSLIAYLHANRHELPERRADLYERLLELLVDEWEKARFKAEDADSARERAQFSLAEFLQIGQDSIRLVLERLAFRAHALQGANQVGTADIAEKDLIYQLYLEAGDKASDQKKLCEYLRDRVGILYQRSGANDLEAVYTFPHRSFQEFLSAMYLRRGEGQLFREYKHAKLEEDEWQELAAWLGRTDPDRWREVVTLAGGFRAQKEAQTVWKLVKALIDADMGGSHAWGLRLAAEVLVDNLVLKDLTDRQTALLARLRQALPKILGTEHLPCVERAAAGRYLSALGDPRPAVTEVDAMPFCYVPAGKFWMGKGEYDQASEEWLKEIPAGEYDLNYGYWVAQFPVTVAQFRQFVEATGFELKDTDALKGHSNAPVVWVSVDDSLAFCEWLTQRWALTGWRVTLPDEPEWEKAARGGLKILQEPVIRMVDDLKADVCDLKSNPEPQRRYPWGNTINDEYVNYEMKAGGVSTQGIYPQGASPYGCHDLAGNVWEWTRSERADYPYPIVGTKEWKQRGSGAGAVCVLRGGAFYNDLNLVRCAVRRDHARDHARDHRYNLVGCRVVLSPFL